MADTKEKTTPSIPLEEEQQEIMKLVTVFTLQGAALAYLFGREPGTLPDDIVKELAPSIVVVCGFLISYEFCDVMSVGMAKGRSGILEQTYRDLPVKEDEEVYFRQRVLTNQLEQMPLYSRNILVRTVSEWDGCWYHELSLGCVASDVCINV